MSRSWLIAIFSLLLSTAYGIDVQFRTSDGAYANGVSSYLWYASGQRQFSGNLRILVYVYGNQDMWGGYVRWTYDGATRYYTFPNSSVVFGAYEVLLINVETGSVTYKGQEFFYDGYEPPPETVEFEWTFGPEYAGAEVEIRDADGNVMGYYLVPAGGGPFTFMITDDSAVLDGAGLYIDGLPVVALRSAGDTSAPPVGVVERPGFALSFDGSYQGGEWQARRLDGSVAASGSAATVGTVLEGRLTIGGNESAEIYTRVPAGDGNGSVWVPSGVILSGGGVTSYTFIGAPENMDVPSVPSQSPMPSPVPVPSPSPDPLPLPSPSPFVPGPGADETTVDDTTIDWPIPDDNLDEQIEEQNRTLLEAFGESFSNINAIGNAFTQGMNMFSGTTLGGVGRDCTLIMGNTAIQLNVPTAVRTGTAVVAYIISLITVVSLVSRMFNAS